jgi:hypothetical protein
VEVKRVSGAILKVRRRMCRGVCYVDGMWKEKCEGKRKWKSEGMWGGRAMVGTVQAWIGSDECGNEH